MCSVVRSDLGFPAVAPERLLQAPKHQRWSAWWSVNCAQRLQGANGEDCEGVHGEHAAAGRKICIYSQRMSTVESCPRAQVVDRSAQLKHSGNTVRSTWPCRLPTAP